VSAGAATLEGFVTDKSGVPVTDAVFYAEADAAGATAKPARSAIVDQINKEFVPFVSVVQTGTSIAFPNKDNIRHHVYSFSPAKKFELKLYSGVPAAPVLFDKPGVVLLGCNIHDWMVAYLLMVDTPFFGKTINGQVRIDGLPAGDYQVKVWHPQLQGPAVAMRVKIEQDRNNSVKFVLDLKSKAQTERAPSGK
jgi:plastocyanin